VSAAATPPQRAVRRPDGTHAPGDKGKLAVDWSLLDSIAIEALAPRHANRST
jgi:hypothetical protein